ncbi:NADPH-dependent FMN reductase [Actinopolyspora mortivallis]|uniref:NADPH-dependent FMN reductase n=1 Tax=Actinopolyspora mortivallis TaxID=33906 RepID=UPI00047A7E77|nr:NADPH-dependent FMN reductase [Actinopolyspora mortivallis]
MDDVRVLAVSGSLRAGSYNTALAAAAQKFAPAGVSIELYESLGGIPLFNEDLERDGLPSSVLDLRRRVLEADGLLIVTPEYNASIPGVLKNALDWMTRPPGDSALVDKPIAVAGASPSNFGSVRAQLALRQMFLGTTSEVVATPEVMVPRAFECFDEAGNLTDETAISLLRELLATLRDRITRLAA